MRLPGRAARVGLYRLPKEEDVTGRDSPMHGRIAWITGAGKGLGRALALELARRGATVAASARTAADLESLAACHPAIHPYAVDVTDERAVQAVVEAIRRDLGEIDVAVLNAGTHKPVTGDALAAEPFRQVFEVNVMGVVHGLAAVVPRMVARRGGHVAVTGSLSGYRGLPTAAAYGATKAALNNMVEALVPDLARFGVTVTVVNPGFVRTPLTDRNTFRMPFLMEPEDAARRLADGLERRKHEIVFPRRLAFVLKIARIIPNPLYFSITRRMVRSKDE